MSGGEFFGPGDAEREIERVNRDARQIFWNTPQNRKIELIIPPTVYPPKEDTDLMAKALHSFPNPHNKRFLEIGCGSGTLSIFAAHLGFHVTSCDINPFAVAATRHAAECNGVQACVLEGGPGPESDGGIEQWSGGSSHDVIVWNLPYLSPIPNSEFLGPFEEAALLDTDEKGLVHRLLNAVKNGEILKPGGIIFLLVSDKFRGKKVRLQALANGFAVRPVSKHLFEDGECIEVIGVWKPFESNESIFEDEIGSTNSELLASSKPTGTFLFTGRQTDGHGRRGRAWSHESRAFAGSWVVNEQGIQTNPGVLQAKGGIALYEAICALSEQEDKVILKWPNDVLLNLENGLRKTGGVLVESRSQGKETRVVLGIGCNLSSDSHRKAEYEIASLDELGGQITNDQFVRTIHASVASMFEKRTEVKDQTNNEIISRFTEYFSNSMKALGIPFYRNEKMRFSSIENSGEIRLKDEKNKKYIVGEGEDVSWSNYR